MGMNCSKRSIRAQPYVKVAYHRILIIVLGIVFRVLVMCMTCKSLTGQVVAFYYDSDCFGLAWLMALVIAGLLVLYFTQIYLKLYQMSDAERYSPNSSFIKLVQAYKHEYWYWEAVLLSRRFAITLFVKFSYVGGGYSNLLLVLVLICYMLAQLILSPFKHVRNNRMETFCILSVLIGFVAVNFDDIASSTFVSLFLVTVIFLPILMALWYVGKLCLNCKEYCRGNDAYFANSRQRAHEHMSKMRARVLNQSLTESKEDKTQPLTTGKELQVSDHSVTSKSNDNEMVTGRSGGDRQHRGDSRYGRDRRYGGDSRYAQQRQQREAQIDNFIEMAQMRKGGREAAVERQRRESVSSCGLEADY